ncbi:MAG: polyamine aminopropyltransferase [Peptococcaceae bacterium]|jgi:spermidine synthase|nr:polyamine aminopropyltransferase [Peptococcaceae bacterium]MDH7524851.1 polyamine aminopropyltransferase [Peptococcaceae bacterium]
MKNDLWATEKQTEDLVISFRIKKILHEEQTNYQLLSVVDTYAYGRMLFLDNCVMTSVKDEFVYHEMISLVALNTHPNPENVLVIGGGDGGTVREVIRHTKVKKVTLVEIDPRVIEISRQYFPEIAVALKDDNEDVKIIVDDGIKFVRENKNKYDVILIDSTDPVGPAEGLFSAEFYKDVYEALKEDGIMVAQSESPFLGQDLIKRINNYLKDVFPIVRLYLANIPTYPTGLWSFTLASKRYDPLDVNPQDIRAARTRYYNKEMHFACFVLPNFVAEIFETPGE